MDIMEFIGLLKEKRRIATILLVAGILVGILAYFVLPLIYETRVTFMVLESKLIRRNLEGRKLDIDTYLNFVNNDFIYHKIYEKLDIQNKYEMDFEQFKRSFEVTSVEDTAIIKLLVTFQNPEISFKIAKILADEALELNNQVIEKEVHSGYRFSETQVQAASTQLETARKALDTFIAQHPVPQMAMEMDLLRNRIAIEKNGELAVFPAIESAIVASSLNPQIMQSGMTPKAFTSLTRIQEEIAETEAKLMVAKADNRKIELAGRLKELNVQLKKKQQILAELKSQIRKLGAQYYSLKFQYIALKSEFTSAQKGYEKIYQTGIESKTEIIGKTKEMTIIDPAVKPEKPVFPKLIFTILGGFFLGILSVFMFIILVGFNRRLNHV